MYAWNSTPSGPKFRNFPARPTPIFLKFYIGLLYGLKLKNLKYFGPIINITPNSSNFETL